MASNCPISTTRLRQICTDACDSAISQTTVYHHASTQEWNNTIINHILKQLISESSSSSTSGEPQYKFIVNTTIIQHLSDPRAAPAASAGTQTGGPVGGTGGESVSLGTDSAKKVGRRGMHSASGAFWNNEKDGMWSYKYEGGENKGMDIVVSVMWVAV